MIFKNICFFIIIIFSLIGIFFFATVVHELIHIGDLSKYDVEGKNLCLFNIPMENYSNWDIAFYQFNFTKSDEKIITLAIDKSENKAYFSFFVILIIYIIILAITLGQWNKTEQKFKSKELNI